MSLIDDAEAVAGANPFSLYAKLALVVVVLLVIAAFGWHEYHAGYTSGAASVQQKWDHQTATVADAQKAQIADAASDALANFHAAGVVSAAADQHQADVASVHDQLTKRVQDYARNSQNVDSNIRTGIAGGCSNGSGNNSPVLSADGLRIWNDANAGIGDSSGQASDHPPIAASGVSTDVATSK